MLFGWKIHPRAAGAAGAHDVSTHFHCGCHKIGQSTLRYTHLSDKVADAEIGRGDAKCVPNVIQVIFSVGVLLRPTFRSIGLDIPPSGDGLTSSQDQKYAALMLKSSTNPTGDEN